MTITSGNFIADLLYFLKNDLSNNVTDPIVSTRPGDSKWVMTSYPQRQAVYPLITIKMINQTATRAGMQTEAMDVTAIVEIRLWARNQKEKDSLSNSIYKRLRDIQFTSSTGSVASQINNYTLLSDTEINEEGEGTPKSRVLQIKYNFYNI